MAGLFKQANSKIPQMAAGISLQTSIYGKPLAIIYGTTRVSGNMLLYGNFNGTLQNSGQGSGKGGLFSAGNAGSQSYNYNAAFAFALCEGPINGIGTVWQDKNMVTLAGLGFTLFTGTYPQTAWGTTVSWRFIDANGSTIAGTSAPLGYNGIAYVADPNFNLGNNTSIPNLQFEVKGILSASVSGKSDADPSQVLSDVLTNSHYGLGFPSARIGSLTTWQTYCLATGLLVSPNYDTQRTGADIITELATATNSAPVWTSGQLTMVPYGDTTVSSSLATYTPNLTPIYALGDNDFLPKPQSGGTLGGASGPVVLHRKRPADKLNSVKVEYLNRAAYYAPAVVIANDQDLIDRYGNRTNGSQSMHLFCDGNAAKLSAELQLRRQARVNNTFQFDLDARYVLLDPMDVISITDSNLGLVNQLARVTNIQENDDGTFSFTAEEILQGTGNSPIYNFNQSLPYNSNPATATGSVNTPTIFEPPSLMFAQGGPPQIWIGASSTDASWGGANVWLSLDNSNFTLAGQIIGAARQGVLTANLSNWAGPNNFDGTDTLSVDLTQSAGTLISGSTLDAQLGHTLCLIDSELLAFQTATLTAANKYNLTNLYRGFYGTSPVGHLTGAQFTRLDNAIFKYTLPPQFINQTIFIKLQSFNLYGQGLQSLASCTVYQFVPGGLGMVHPLAQALNVGANQDLGSVATAPVVFEDYGFITGQVSGATIYYFPQAVDMHALASAFSASFVQASSQYMAFPVVGGQQTSGANQAASLWFRRQSLGDSEMLWGVQTDNNNYFVLRFDTSNQLHFTIKVGSTTIVDVFSTIPIASTASWHHAMWLLNINSLNGSTDRVRLIVDGTTCSSAGGAAFVNISGSSMSFKYASLFGGSGGVNINLGGPTSTVSASTFAYFGGEIAEYYNLDAISTDPNSQFPLLTSTYFASGSPGFPVQFVTFRGNISAYLPFVDPTSSGANLGRDFSGQNNNYTVFGGMTSTNQTQDYP